MSLHYAISWRGAIVAGRWGWGKDEAGLMIARQVGI